MTLTLFQVLALRKSYIPKLTSKLEIRNCFKVTVSSQSILELSSLRSIYMYNISNLVLQEEAFSWGSTELMDVYTNLGINITIENATMEVVPSYAFKGQLHSIYLKNAKIGLVQSFAFSKLAGSERISLENCDIRTVEQQAMKKFLLDFFEVQGGTIGALPSYSVIDVTVRKIVKLEKVLLQGIRSQAFRIHAPQQMRIENCFVVSADPDAFKVSTNGPVFISDNVFSYLGMGVFAGIHVDHKFQFHSGKQELVFENNTLIDFANGALTFNTSGFRPVIDRIVIKKQCSCSDVNAWTSKLVHYTTSAQPPTNMAKLMWCFKGKTDTVAGDYYAKKCTSTSATVYIVIGAVAVALVLAVALCVLAYFLCRRRAKRYMNVPTDTNCNRHSACSGGSNHIMVVPEGKTYRETELHVIVERAEPITEFKLEPVRSELVPKT
ncbi:hypothetical protein AAG570_012255 [Ranatra chinensis]|uniref:Uncharacterized protein n=1 Tax=Ranatra chinensis TaxID=642074 RepID=A0ABD0YWR2_9HEMI